MIDLHCHILHGVDDGPQTPEDTVALAREFVATGTTTVVATPHVSWDWPGNTSEPVAAQVAEVRALLADHDVPLEVRAGGEVALARALDLPDEELERLTLAGGGWLLLECPLSPLAIGVEAGVDAIRQRGHERLLLAHPERVPAFQRDPAMLARLIDAGALTSVTAAAFTGGFGKDVARFARRLLADGHVHSVASDAHSTVRRPPGLSGPLEASGLEADLIDRLVRRAPAAILAGERPEPAPAAALPDGAPDGLLTRLLRPRKRR